MTSKLPFFGKKARNNANDPEKDHGEEGLQTTHKAPKWSFGVLNDPDTIEVPGERPPIFYLRDCI